VIKLLLILALGGAVANAFAAHNEPPLLIDSAPAAPLDAQH
jgi:hypothetical protein